MFDHKDHECITIHCLQYDKVEPNDDNTSGILFKLTSQVNSVPLTKVISHLNLAITVCNLYVVPENEYDVLSTQIENLNSTSQRGNMFT